MSPALDERLTEVIADLQAQARAAHHHAIFTALWLTAMSVTLAAGVWTSPRYHVVLTVSADVQAAIWGVGAIVAAAGVIVGRWRPAGTLAAGALSGSWAVAFVAQQVGHWAHTGVPSLGGPGPMLAWTALTILWLARFTDSVRAARQLAKMERALGA